MTANIIFATILLLFLQHSEGLPLHGIARRQARANPDWVTSSRWSDCTASCGGGIEVRSVRCLDTDDVISPGCNLQIRPESFRVCAQIDCNSGAPIVSQPIDGSYTPSNQPGISSMVLFTNTGAGTYNVQQTTEEEDGTVTEVSRIRLLDRTQTNVTVRGRDNIEIGSRQNGENTELLVDGNSVLNLNNVDTVSIPSGQTFQYTQSTLNTPLGSIEGINTLNFFDGFRFYRFDNDKINDLPGPGTITFNAVTGEALYLPASTGLQNQLEVIINGIPPVVGTTTFPPMPTNPPTDPPAEPTDAIAGPTDPPVMQTDPPAEQTDAPVVVTDGPQVPVVVDPGNMCPDGKSRSKKNKRGRKGKSRDENGGDEMDCDDTSRKSKGSKRRGSKDEDEVDVGEIDIVGADESSPRSRSRGRGRSRSRSSENGRETSAQEEENITSGSQASRGRGRSRSRSTENRQEASAQEEENITSGSRSSRSRGRGRG